MLAISAQKLERIAAGVPGGAANVQDLYPLLPLQEGMVFHHRLQDQNDSYLSRWLLEFDSGQRQPAAAGSLPFPAGAGAGR